MDIDYVLLSKNDNYSDLLKLHQTKEISEFIHVDLKNYFNYVTSTDNVYYYKMIKNNDIIGGIHCEIIDTVLHLSIFINPLFQNQGYGTKILNGLIKNKFNFNITEIIANIEYNNIKSINLFKKVGFVKRIQIMS